MIVSHLSPHHINILLRNTTIPDPEQIIPGESFNNYIITFDKKGNLKAHLSQLNKFIAGLTCIHCAINNMVTRVYKTMTVKYYSGIFDSSVIKFIKSSRGVTSLSLDREIEHFAVTVQCDATWYILYPISSILIR